MAGGVVPFTRTNYLEHYMPQTHDSKPLRYRVGPLVLSCEPVFWHLQRYPGRRVAPARPPLTEVAAPRELEQPFRRGHGRVLRLPLTRRALVLGWWEPAVEDVLAEEESDRLLEAIEGAHIPGITADDIAQWARARDWSRLELLVRRLRALLGLGAPPAPPPRAVAPSLEFKDTWTVVPWADDTVIDLEDARVARIAVKYGADLDVNLLPGGYDEHPAWCRCQRVCGGDQ